MENLTTMERHLQIGEHYDVFHDAAKELNLNIDSIPWKAKDGCTFLIWDNSCKFDIRMEYNWAFQCNWEVEFRITEAPSLEQAKLMIQNEFLK
jgi:hypothetical protein